MNGNKGASMQRKRRFPLAAFPVLTSEEVHQDGSVPVPDPPPAFSLSPPRLERITLLLLLLLFPGSWIRPRAQRVAGILWLC